MAFLAGRYDRKKDTYATRLYKANLKKIRERLGSTFVDGGKYDDFKLKYIISNDITEIKKILDSITLIESDKKIYDNIIGDVVKSDDINVLQQQLLLKILLISDNVFTELLNKDQQFLLETYIDQYKGNKQKLIEFGLALLCDNTQSFEEFLEMADKEFIEENKKKEDKLLDNIFEEIKKSEEETKKSEEKPVLKKVVKKVGEKSK